jgi:putative transcriptional regulator
MVITMNFSKMSNEAILAELGQRLRRTRLNRNLTQAELARESGVSRRAVQKVEEGDVTTVETLINILRGLSQLSQLNPFLPEPPPSPVQLAKLQGQTRRRASGKRKRPTSPGTWTWKE